MNALHMRICRSSKWEAYVAEELLPSATRGVELGGDVLEIGPGFGTATRRLVDAVPRLTALEIDPGLRARLQSELGSRARIVEGDATAMPFADASFSAAVCFTMLHHVPSAAAQDRLLAETCRVLAPGGVFTGTDSVGRGLKFTLVHVGDTKVLVDPATFPDRLRRAGFEDVSVHAGPRAIRFRARKPTAA